jgi:parallel beta-helix repeat protein
MQKISLWTVVLLAWSTTCLSKTIYVSSSLGSDAYTSTQAQNPATPWKTIAKVATLSYVAGDSVLFRKGDIWREQLTINWSGSLATPIVFGSYGSGNLPEINGADVITGWSLYSGNIYVANVASTVTQLFIDGKRQTYARWPNSGWQTITANSADKLRLTSTSITQPTDYWAGATAVIHSADWQIEPKVITSNSGNTMVWSTATIEAIKTNFGFYMEGKLEEVDSPGEWFYTGGKVYLYVAPGDTATNHLIEGSTRSYGIDITYGRQYLNIRQLSIRNPGLSGIHIYNNSYVRVENNTIANSKERGIHADVYPPNSRHHLYVNNNVVTNTIKDGIRVATVDTSEIKNNKVSRVVDLVSPKLAFGMIFYGKNMEVSGNELDSTVFSGFFIGNDSQNMTVKNNTISNCMLLMNDGGGIYTGSNHTNLWIKNNVVKDTRGNWSGTPGTQSSAVGIYLDESTNGANVAGNIVVNAANGIKLHKAHNNLIVNNVVHNTSLCSVRIHERSLNQVHDNTFYNNIYSNAGPGQLTYFITRTLSSTVPLGIFKNNIHFNADTARTIKQVYEGGTTSIYTLTQWRTATGQDTNSIAANPLFVNATGTLSVPSDFKIPCNSPGINAGISVGFVTDFEGNSPFGITDIGAYEYQDSACFSGARKPGYGLVEPVIDVDGKNRLDVFPNPSANGYVTIRMTGNFRSGTASVSLHSANGELRFQSDMQLENGSGNFVRIPKQLSSGIYLLTIAGPDYLKQARIAIVRQ